MVDPHPGHDVLSRKLQDQRVAPREDLLVFGMNRNELVDTEEAPVIDLVDGRPPVRCSSSRWCNNCGLPLIREATSSSDRDASSGSADVAESGR